MPKFTLQQLYQLYKEDKMVLHSMPTALIDERPSKMNDKSCLMSGSLMFFGGLQHQNGHHVPNAVARFGDDAHDTLFATVHDLDAVFETHEALEQQKPQDKRGKAFVLFANSDIGNLTKDKDCCPPKDYMVAQWGACPPVQCERDRTFDFRHFCSTKDEKEDPSMEQEGAHGNEMRAVLNRDNMVGLLYIHDPQFSPQQHAALAKKLCSNFGGELEMGVLKVHTTGGHQGDLLLVEGGGDAGGDGGGGAGGDGGAAEAGQEAGTRDGDGAEGAVAAAADGDAADGGGGEGGDDGASAGQAGAEQTAEKEQQQQQSDAKRRKLGEELARGGAEALEGKDADGPSSCRLLSFWEYLQQCK